MRDLLLTLVIALGTLLHFPANVALAEDSVEVVTDDVVYSDAGGKVVGYFARPKIEGKLPAVVLIHEWWGLNDDIKNKTRKFAELGYVALAVDLYHGQSTTDRETAGRLAGSVRGKMDVAQQNLKDAVATLKKSPHVDSNRLATIGWCFGGGWSYEMAKNDLGIKASVIYYGRFNPADDLQKMRTQIVGHFAEEDRGIRIDTVKEFQAKLKTLNGDHEIYIYPNTTHGFASREGQNPNFKKREADLAWKRTLEFLEKHVVTSKQSSDDERRELSPINIQPGKQTENFFTIPAPAEGRPDRLPVLVYTPENYDPNKQYPLLLFLHGLGESGTGEFQRLAIHGPPKLIAKEGKHFPFVVVSPQSPKPTGDFQTVIDSWKSDELMALLDNVESQYSINKSRVYVSGLSMGGFGTWRLVANHPERFAAAIPVCGGGKPEWAESLKSTPIWAFHGAKDSVVPLKGSEEMVTALQRAGGDVKLTIYPDLDHDSWTKTYDNPAIYDWLLRHSK